MKISALLLALGASLVSCAPSSAPLGATLIGPNQYQSGAVQFSRYIGPSNYPGYYIYNYLQVDQGRGIPIAIFGAGSPGVSQVVQPTYNYYGTPVYDYRYQFNQIYPGFPSFQPPLALPGGQPSFIPAQGPIYPPTTQRPFFEFDDGIEKLDEKVDPSLENNGAAHPNDDDDSVTIDAI